MKKFVALYYAPAEAMAAMATMTEADKAKGMEGWMKWRDKAGDAIVDFGAPLMPGHQIDATQTWKDGSKKVTGYSVLQGESIESIKSLCENHPHTFWAEGCIVEVHESMPM